MPESPGAAFLPPVPHPHGTALSLEVSNEAGISSLTFGTATGHALMLWCGQITQDRSQAVLSPLKMQRGTCQRECSTSRTHSKHSALRRSYWCYTLGPWTLCLSASPALQENRNIWPLRDSEGEQENTQLLWGTHRICRDRCTRLQVLVGPHSTFRLTELMLQNASGLFLHLSDKSLDLLKTLFKTSSQPVLLFHKMLCSCGTTSSAERLSHLLKVVSFASTFFLTQ